MRVVIKQKEYDYIADFPNGWFFSSGDYFKFPVTVGSHLCFIKRFENKNQNSIPGWELLLKLENRYTPNLARLYSINSVEEKGNQVYYLFYEFLIGNTLDKLVAVNSTIDLIRLNNDIFSALSSLQQYNYWFADFIERNIFREAGGGFKLIGIDDAQPTSKHPNNDMDANRDYWALVSYFYIDVLNYNDFKISHLPGLTLNYLQAIFLILRLKISFDRGWMTDRYAGIFDELPDLLNRMDFSFKEVFIKVYAERNAPQYAIQAKEIKDLVIQKIINNSIAPLTNTKAVIEEFVASAYAVKAGDAFELSWKVKNATSIELYRNGALQEVFTAQTSSITTMIYDGHRESVSYDLIAYKGKIAVTSGPIVIKLKDEIVKPSMISRPEIDLKEEQVASPMILNPEIEIEDEQIDLTMVLENVTQYKEKQVKSPIFSEKQIKVKRLFAYFTKWLRIPRSIKDDMPLNVPSPNDLDAVKCTVFAPPTASAGERIMVQVFAHLYSEENKIKKLAIQYDDSVALRGSKSLGTEIMRDTELTFCLSMQGVKIDQPVQKMIWRGTAESVQFDVFIPEEHSINNIIGTVYVSQDNIPFGHVKFLLSVEVINESSKPPLAKLEKNETWRRYHHAFISYASEDRTEVLKRVQMLPRAGIDFFQDVLSLEPGERWKRELYRQIDKCDVFFLFWSNAAKNSRWVMQEVRYAMQLKGEALSGNPEIVPVIIEGPPPVSPPPELHDIHFNDSFIYFINAHKKPNWFNY